MAFFLLLLLIAVALGIIGVLAKGLLYLLAIGVAVLVVDLIVVAFRIGHHRHYRHVRR